MTARRPILLLFIFGILIFPWQLFDFCATHPLGHHHEHHDGPSPCELRKQFKGTAYWPPMDCYKIAVDAEDFQQPEKVKPVSSALAIIAIFFTVIQFDPEEKNFAIPPPESNSGPPLPVNSLRGPPFV